MRITGDPAEVGVNLTEHTPLDSLYVVSEERPGLLLDQATLPVGTSVELVTVVLQVTVEPTTTEEWLYEMASVGTGRGLTVTRSVEELAVTGVNSESVTT